MYNEEFQNMNIDLSILVRKNHELIIIVSVYVNDFLIVNKTMQKIYYMKIVLNKVFKMSDLEEVSIIKE